MYNNSGNIYNLALNLNDRISSHKTDIIILTISDEESYKFYELLKFFIDEDNIEILILPSMDIIPYDKVSPSNNLLYQRSKTLTNLACSSKRKILITSSINSLMKYPDKNYFKSGYSKLKIGEKIDIDIVSEFFLINGFTRVSCARDSGEFSKRGDIFDVVLSNDESYRINFEWDKIGSIKKFDTETQISRNIINEIEIYPASELILNKQSVDNFKKNFLKYFNVNYTKNYIYENIISYIKFSGIESIAPIFYEKISSIFDYLNSPLVISHSLYNQSLSNIYTDYEDFYASRIEQNKNLDYFYPAFPVSDIIFDTSYIKDRLDILEKYNFFDEKIEVIADLTKNGISETPIQQLINLANKNLDKKILISSKNTSSSERIKKLLSEYGISFIDVKKFQECKKNIFNISNFEIDESIISKFYLIISDKHLIGEKKYIKSVKKRLKNITDEIDNFHYGDLVVHKDHGIGRFEGIENFEISSQKHDCIKLVYAKGDKLFIPVENIDLIKKFGSEESPLDHLGSVSWQRRKAKIKDRIGEIAKNLINLAANRQLSEIEPIEIDVEKYDKFSNSFQFTETDDQLGAINDIKSDFLNNKPMERLICGDVGFGKTEVAMRAAFMVASSIGDKKQIAIITPTTILCRQHFENFKKRFKNTNLNIVQLSRLVNNSTSKAIKYQLETGEVDIVIGTHAILNSNIKFKNLSLIIIDEEQHFGVKQKEYLKQLKNSVHTLSLSATPIPRTLQMSMLGVKDLSLIATPPIDRLSIKTSILQFDDVIARDALMKEHFRGGRSFIVCPRIKDIEYIEQKLSKIAPELKYKIAHGQMPPHDIDSIMNDFYDGKIDILVSTTIVESGLDVPDANTMIIYKPEILGLSQLYQLRGRVGRGKVRGYAYLMTSNKKLPTKNALKRLEIMQTIDSLGAGFTIASHDMDIRGFGNLLGEEQSGHIKEVGSELYNEMLDQAIANLKNEKEVNKSLSANIKLNLPVYIPDEYITDGNLRLSIYRRAANLENETEIEEFIDEMNDRFGKIPESFSNLLKVIEVKLKCNDKKIIQLDAGTNGFIFTFSDEADNVKIMNFVNKYPRNTKIKSNNKFAYIKNITEKMDIFNEIKNILIEL